MNNNDVKKVFYFSTDKNGNGNLFYTVDIPYNEAVALAKAKFGSCVELFPLK